MKWLTGLAVAALIAAAPAGAARLDEQGGSVLAASQSAIGTALPALTFTGIDGKPAPLSRYRGKPLILSMVYTGCSDVCPAIIDNLHRAAEVAQDALGADRFNIVTIGFDTANDTPARMRSFAAERGIRIANWDFLAADQASLDALAAATGFTIAAFAGGFDHMAQVTIADGDGTIRAQVYGGAFDPPAVVEPLKDLVFGTYRPIASLDGLIDRVKLFCTVYNPNTGRYYFNYSMFIGIAIGLMCLLAVAGWLVREFRRSTPPRGTA